MRLMGTAHLKVKEEFQLLENGISDLLSDTKEVVDLQLPQPNLTRMSVD